MKVLALVLGLANLLAVYVVGYVRGYHTGIEETEDRWREAVGRKADSI